MVGVVGVVNQAWSEAVGDLNFMQITDKDTPHDAVVLYAARRALNIARHLNALDEEIYDNGFFEWMPTYDVVYEWELEPNTEHNHNSYSNFVDLAITPVNSDRPVLLLEVKSSKETATPSNVYRQIRHYEKRSGGIRAVLVVAHDLPEYVRDYFQEVGVTVVDARRFKCSS